MQRTITVKANSERVEKISGKAFAVVSATAAFQLEAGRGGRRSMNAGGRLVGARFERLTFREINGADNVITYEAGEDERDISVPLTVSGVVATTVKDAPTYIEAHPDNSIGAGQGVIFTGLSGANQRKQIAVSNGSATERLFIRDDQLFVGSFVQPGQTWTLVTNGYLEVFNPSAGAIDVAIMQTFYF